MVRTLTIIMAALSILLLAVPASSVLAASAVTPKTTAEPKARTVPHPKRTHQARRKSHHGHHRPATPSRHEHRRPSNQ